jgi:hypothetical protein
MGMIRSTFWLLKPGIAKNGTEIPNHNPQIPNNIEIPNFNDQNISKEIGCLSVIVSVLNFEFRSLGFV